MLLKTTGSNTMHREVLLIRWLYDPDVKFIKKNTLPQLLGKSAIEARSHKKYRHAREENSVPSKTTPHCRNFG